MADEAKSFDPLKHMRKIRTRNGMQDYLDVKFRVAWLRAEHPTAQVITDEISCDERQARFKCIINLPNGAIGCGHGSETKEDFPDYIEKAETKAIGRACATLGYGTDSATDFDDGAGTGASERREVASAQQQQIDQRRAWYDELAAEGRRLRIGFTGAMDSAALITTIEKAGGKVEFPEGATNSQIREAIMASVKAMPTPAPPVRGRGGEGR